MELDTDAAVSLSEQTYKAIWDDGKAHPIQPAKIQLHTYTGQTTLVIRVVNVVVNHQQQTKKLLLMIVKGESPTLLGRGWLNQLTLGTLTGVLCIMYKYKRASPGCWMNIQGIKDELGIAKNLVSTLHVDPTVSPKF